MNIVAALRTNRPLRRPNKASHTGSHGDGFVDPLYLVASHGLSMDDLLADDWEVEEDRVEITWLTVLVALQKSTFPHYKWTPAMNLDVLKKELGFGDK